MQYSLYFSPQNLLTGKLERSCSAHVCIDCHTHLLKTQLHLNSHIMFVGILGLVLVSRLWSPSDGQTGQIQVSILKDLPAHKFILRKLYLIKA